MRRSVGVLVLAFGLLALGVAAPDLRAEPNGARHGLTLLSDTVLSDDGRLHELTFRSEALGGEVAHRVLLPAGYDDPADTDVRYPMLLLLHGASGDQRAWTDSSDVEGHTADLDLVVVMPDGGELGFYTDWLDGPQWETHHLDELVPWIDATYRTVGTREGRAVAGLSMGGFGSTAYAARHPDRFLAAASFSGAVDIADLGVAEAALLQALGFGDDRRWGPFLTHEAYWRGHNPPDLATNLRWTDLWLTSGNGVPCAGDSPRDSFLEAGTYLMAVGLIARMALAGIVPHSELRLCGTHSGPYFEQDLVRWLPHVMALFADPPPPPEAFDFRTTDARTSVWGWSFTAHRPAVEFLDLRAVSRDGLTATGSGRVDVVTAPVYEPGATYELAQTGAGTLSLPLFLLPPLAAVGAQPTPTATVVADDAGRLSFTLDLGTAHTAHQYAPQGLVAELASLGTYFRTAAVTITPA